MSVFFADQLHGVTHRPATEQSRAARYRDAMTIIRRDYASDLPITDLARSLACSIRQIQRAFSEEGRTTFREALAEVRIQAAAELLVTTRLTVTEIARAVNYARSGFAPAFRRHMGQHPLGYRRSPPPVAQAEQERQP